MGIEQAFHAPAQVFVPGTGLIQVGSTPVGRVLLEGGEENRFDGREVTHGLSPPPMGLCHSMRGNEANPLNAFSN
jgi:hypothetical protein